VEGRLGRIRCGARTSSLSNESRTEWLRQMRYEIVTTLAVLNIVPPEQKHSGSIADDPINLAHLLEMPHIVDLNPEWFNN
jgi:hypothetical protein